MSSEAKIKAFQTPKSDTDAIVLDFLTKNGYAEAAAQFCSEANREPLQHEADINTHRSIKHAIYSGKAQEAISLINNYESCLLDHHPDIHFALLRLHLIELIRPCLSKGDDTSVFLPAVAFAQKHLAPRAAENPDLLRSLEKAMALIAFPVKDHSSELRDLLNPKLRKEVAELVNEILLPGKSELETLLHLHSWSEKSLVKAVAASETVGNNSPA